jgi:adenylosuccinate synthase
VVVNDKSYKLQLLPSGILYKGKTCVVGNGVVVAPESIIKEIRGMQERGIDVSGLRISDRAHVVMPYHKKLDALQEEALGDAKIGTTKNGIGPCYMDKAARVGIRVTDLMDAEVFEKKLARNMAEKNKLFTAVYGAEPLDYETVLNEYKEYAKILAPYVTDTATLLHQTIARGEKILFEGAQATFLDLDHGTYPFVTSSNPVAGGVCTGAGIGPKAINTVVGVVKAYSTRVGEGPFPTELLDEIGDNIRARGHEYGTVTGRPRRCGWLDARVVRYAAMLNSLDYLAVTRLDILDELPSLNICVGYRYHGRLLDEIPASLKMLAEVEPVYEEMPGWQQDISGIRKYEELPLNARRYVERLSEVTGVPLGVVSVGPGRDQTILLHNMF